MFPSLRRHCLLIAFVLVAGVLSGCTLSVSIYTDAERAYFDPKPFGGFDENPESAARSLSYHFLGQPDVTLGDAILAYQTFAQFEYVVNELKTEYLVVTQSSLQDMEEARLEIRRALNVPTTARVVDAVQTYATRAKGRAAQDLRQIEQNKSVLKAAMTKAGYALDSYNARVEHGQDDNGGRRTMP